MADITDLPAAAAEALACVAEGLVDTVTGVPACLANTVDLVACCLAGGCDIDPDCPMEEGLQQDPDDLGFIDGLEGDIGPDPSDLGFLQR